MYFRLIQPQRKSILAGQRFLFTIPAFLNFSAPDSGIQKFRESRRLPYSPKELYEVVADVKSYAHFVPYCTRANIINSSSEMYNDSHRTLMNAELTVAFLSFKESYTSRVTCYPYKSVEAVASSSTPLFKTLSTTWRFQSALQPPNLETVELHRHDSRENNEPTLVTLDLAYAFANPVHAAVSSAFFGQVSKLMINAFEQRCIDLYGRRDI